MDVIILHREIYGSFIEYLKGLADPEYRAFIIRITPGIGACFGVRMPILKDIAKKLSKGNDLPEAATLLHTGQSYEERILEGFLLARLSSVPGAAMMKYIDMYIPRINSWAVNDSFVSALRGPVLNDMDPFYGKAMTCIRSDNPYEVRFGLVMLNDYFSGPEHVKQILKSLENIKTGHYYVDMGISWLVSTLYIANKERIVKFLKEAPIDDRCINKSIQKITESRKVSKEEKDYLRTLKRTHESRT